ncbi:ABC transporter ATP-binding protein [Ruficoccus amylovorans]|uniref:ABC transporter ATP-binding protein n=1 Tax=Ruficoccus amylovorans TaxID=1804625 RepID=A0A842HHH4_9BACT|nr:ABC transporter ATP-binding protein [Ruficoccus amylovorans]MBC2595779.1 ABC transporter ATP-binding protein [Ruficoccus amylovorans]
MNKYKRYFKYIRQSLHLLIIAVGAGIIFGASSGFGMPVIFDKVLRKIFMERAGEHEYSANYVIGVALLLPLIFGVRAIAGYVSGYFTTKVSLEVLRNIKQDIFSKIQDSPIAFFDKYTTGDLIVRLNNDTNAIQAILTSFSSEIFRQPLQVIGAVSFLIYLSFTNGEIVFLLVFIAAVPFCILPVQMMRKKLKMYMARSQGELSRVAQLFNENLDAAHEVRLFNMQEAQKGLFRDLNRSFQNFCMKIAKYELMQQPIMEMLAATMVAVTFVYAYETNIDFPTFSAVGIALYFTIDPIKRIMRMCSDLIKATPMFERINEILEYESTVPEPENPVPIDRLKGEIRFEGVNFAYKDKPVLMDANIVIPAGTGCALVGESGAGKSTFAKLSMRLYDPVSGVIKADGIPLHDIASRDYAANIGSVPQYPVLFNDTVYNNILIAKPDATPEEVYEATRSAYAHDFIMSLEAGYDTIVGERGDKLSGGQKQRIAIARVFLKNPPIIILDEATSALDSNSEAFIQKALDKLMDDRTVLIIAHRFSTIKNVRKIIVFEQGRIIDYGSHAELMERCPHYKHLYQKQAVGHH